MIIADRVKQLEEEIQSIGERLSGVRSGAINVLDQNVKLDKLAGATYDNLHQHINNTISAARISGGGISDSGGGQIDVALGKGILKITDSEIGENVQFDWSTEINIALADGETSWVGIEYDGVTLQGKVKVDTDLSNFTFTTDFILGRVYRDGNTLYILNAGSYYSNFQHKVCFRFFDGDGFHRAAGAVIADAGNLDFEISEGAFYCGTTRYTTAQFDCSGADTFAYWYRDGGAGWTTVAGTGQIDNGFYDDGDGVLGALTPNRYGVHWIYLCHDGSVHVQYGQGDYRLNEAEAALVPPTPDFMTYNCILVGKIISQEGTATLIAVSSAFEEIFIGATASIHNELGGLQGGQANEYYHLKSAEHGYVSGVNAQSLLTTASPTFTDLTINVPSNIYALSHDSFADFVGNEHIDHTAVSVSAGTGLSGGGTIAANRTINLSHLGIQSLANPGADRIMFWDDTAGAMKWLSLGNSLNIVLTVMDTIQDIRTSASPQFAGLTLTGNIVMPDGGTIGQAAGPLLTFDDTLNYLEITGCKVGIGTTTPVNKLDVQTGNDGAISLSFSSTLYHSIETDYHGTDATKNRLHFYVSKGDGSGLELALTLSGDGHIKVYDWDDAVMREISFGADDSGGGGFKVLRVPN